MQRNTKKIGRLAPLLDKPVPNSITINSEGIIITGCIHNQGIKFDYRIRQGASRVRNAVRLMDYLGYPKEIVNNINSRVNAIPDTLI